MKYIRIGKSHFTAPLSHHLKTKFRLYIQRYTSPNESFEYSYPLNLIKEVYDVWSFAYYSFVKLHSNKKGVTT